VYSPKLLFPVGVSCVGFEEQFKAILRVTEACRLPKVSGSNSKPSRKGNRLLKWLECSIKYDSKFETSSRGIGKERGSPVFNKA
jgi:hypothetical protein